MPNQSGSQTIAIRQLRVRDLSPSVYMELRALSALSNPECTMDEQRVKETLLARGSGIFVAKPPTGELVGLACVSTSFSPWGHSCMLHYRAVLPTWQGRGIAKRLMEEVIRFARAQHAASVLSINEGDSATLQMNLQRGFCVETPTDLVRMYLRL